MRHSISTAINFPSSFSRGSAASLDGLFLQWFPRFFSLIVVALCSVVRIVARRCPGVRWLLGVSPREAWRPMLSADSYPTIQRSYFLPRRSKIMPHRERELIAASRYNRCGFRSPEAVSELGCSILPSNRLPLHRRAPKWPSLIVSSVTAGPVVFESPLHSFCFLGE